MRRVVVFATLLLVTLGTAVADQERPNEPIVVAAEDGYCYAKSIPKDKHGERGITQIIRVERGVDKLVHTYEWYAQELHIDCLWPYDSPPEISVVQLGPWPRGRTADKDTLAIAFYLDGRLLKRYSTFDIAGAAANVKATSDHYTVFETVDGYRWGAGHQRFVVRTIDGRTLVFDSETGERVTDKVIQGPSN